MRLAREWDELISRVRALEGFHDFLAARPFAELAEAGRDGPVVLVTISTIRCDALIVTPDSGGSGVRVVPLPVTWKQVDDVANQYLKHLIEGDEPDATFRERQRARHTMHATLEWLWDNIAQPVVAALGYAQHPGPPTPGRSLPRIWWCPTASLTLLPLHAAGYYPRSASAADDGPSMLSTAVSSYTPNLAALLRARRGAPAGPATMLAVAMPETPGGQAPLPKSLEELRTIAAHFPGPSRHQSLIGDQATRAAVRHGLGTHSWVHLACHGGADWSDPSQSAFALWDGLLTTVDIADLPNPAADLAFLSACDTATGGTQLPDEAIHLASALQLAGYRHVIATLWAIGDLYAPSVTKSVYNALAVDGTPDANRAARALHDAVVELHAAHPTEPAVWAPYIHVGA